MCVPVIHYGVQTRLLNIILFYLGVLNLYTNLEHKDINETDYGYNDFKWSGKWKSSS